MDASRRAGRRSRTSGPPTGSKIPSSPLTGRVSTGGAPAPEGTGSPTARNGRTQYARDAVHKELLVPVSRIGVSTPVGRQRGAQPVVRETRHTRQQLGIAGERHASSCERVWTGGTLCRDNYRGSEPERLDAFPGDDSPRGEVNGDTGVRQQP